jgi:alpha-L-rhamnosidase
MADQRDDGAVPHVVPDPTRLHPDKLPGFFGSTGWGDAICVVPWTLWLHYGDVSVLEETLPAMVKWVDFVWSISDGPVVRPPRAWGARGFSFGDWLQPKGPSEKPLPTIGDDAAATIYLYISSLLTAKAAQVLGNADIATRMEKRAEAVKAAFQREFITPSGRLAYDDQTSYALAILHDLIPAQLLPAASDYFKATIARADGRIGTGFIGTPALLPALLKIGEPRLAAAVFLQEEVPGWLYQVKSGATTIWERWDAIRADGTTFEPAMNSYNHYAYGAVCQWLFEAVAGIRPDEDGPGFRHIVFEPTVIAELSPVKAHHDSAAGRIEAGWKLEGDRVTYDLVVPLGARGTLVLGPSYKDAAIDGAPLPFSSGAQQARAELAPGSHKATFRIASARPNRN